MKNSDEAMKVAIIFYVKNKIEIDVIRRLIIKFQSFSDDWPTSVTCTKQWFDYFSSCKCPMCQNLYVSTVRACFLLTTAKLSDHFQLILKSLSDYFDGFDVVGLFLTCTITICRTISNSKFRSISDLGVGLLR